MVPGRLLRFSIGMILAVTALSGLLYHLGGIDVINSLPRVPLCLFHAITGVACPGCGMTRSFLSIGQLRFGDAIHWNPFSMPFIVIMGIYLLLGRTPPWLHRPWVVRTALIAVVTFWVFRLALS